MKGDLIFYNTLLLFRDIFDICTIKYKNKIPHGKINANIQKYTVLAILTLSIVVGIFSHIPSSYAQESNETTTTTATSPEEQHTDTEDATATTQHSETEAEQKDHSKTTTVRDSVVLLLQDRIIPATDFIHLYDSTPYHIMNGHIALKVPCEDDSTSPIQVLIGSAPNITAASLENIPTLSTPGEQCLYHVDLIPSGNATIITDIALSNTAEEDIEFPPSSTVVIGINEVMKGEHGHSESTEEHSATASGTTEAEHTE